MKYLFTVILAALFTITHTNAQEFTGIASYQSKTSFDMEGRFEGRQMSEQQKKQIAERMKSMLEKDFTLKFTKAESLYTEDEKLEAPGAAGGGRMRWGAMFSQGGVYKNVADSIYAQKNDLMGKIFLIKDSLPELQWKLEKDSKMIGQYAAFKATATRKIEGDLMGSFSRRRNAERNGEEVPPEELREEVITAWYTPQIPINQGPGDFWGLPGLILEVSTSNTIILCNKIVLNPKEKVAIAIPDKGKEVGKGEYNAIVEEKTREMAERLRSGGGGRRGGRG
ncbi:MAG: GLPGLI family protein [Leeuwenhoekiella sp.]